jgi:S1-C subfamily serine protease
MSNVSAPSSDEALPPAAEIVALRREALLPTERNRGIGSVTIACTLAGLASGLALATTLMAMQVADNIGQQRAQCTATTRAGHAFLGIQYSHDRQGALVDTVFRGSPADDMGLRPGDVIESINGMSLMQGGVVNLQTMVFSQVPGSEVELYVNRDGAHFVSHPLLAEFPEGMTRPTVRYSHK